MMDAAFEDLFQLGKFLERIADVSLVGDDKYGRLSRTAQRPPHGTQEDRRSLDQTVFTPEFTTDKVLVFTEYADTARYLERRLREDGIADVDRLEHRKADRLRMIQRFAPHYNKVDAENAQRPRTASDPGVDRCAQRGREPAGRPLIVNYDLHWNPVRLMQRIGRVDRRMTPDIEAAIVKEKPKLPAAPSRSATSFPPTIWNAC